MVLYRLGVGQAEWHDAQRRLPGCKLGVSRFLLQDHQFSSVCCYSPWPGLCTCLWRKKKKQNFKDDTANLVVASSCTYFCFLRSFINLFGKGGLHLGGELSRTEMMAARDDLLLRLRRGVYSGQMWETELLNKLNFYLSLFIVESRSVVLLVTVFSTCSTQAAVSHQDRVWCMLWNSPVFLEKNLWI